MVPLKKNCVFLIILSLLCQLFHVAHLSAGMNTLTSDDAAAICKAAGIPADAAMIEKLATASPTLAKIDAQTNGTLTAEKWIDILKKLGIQPTAEMQLSEWLTLLEKIGVLVKKETGPAIAVATPVRKEAAIPLSIPDETADVPRITASAPQPEKNTTVAASSAATLAVVSSQPWPPESGVIVATAAGKQADAAEKSSSLEKAPPRISLDLRGMDIISALKMIALKGELSIVTAGNVKGTVTIYLKDINLFDALKMILEMNDLAYVREDSVIKVMTAADYEKLYGKKFSDKTVVEVVKLSFARATTLEKLIAPVKSKVGQVIADANTNMLILIDTPTNIEQMKKLVAGFDAKLETRVFPLNYAKPKDIAERIKNILSLGISDVQIDEKNSLLIVTDFKDKLDETARLISSFDRRHQEVLIESKIVQIMLNDQFKMGVNWENAFSSVNNQPMAGTVTGNFSAFAVGSTGMKLSVGTMEVNNFNAVFDFLQTVGKTNLISSPRISALEGEEAKILVGTKEAYVTTTVTTSGSGVSSTAEAVTFVDVGVKLYVTPTIGDDEYVTMKIRPEVSSVERTITTSQGNTIPIVRTSQAETSIMVKNGVTVVLAGLMEDKKTISNEGIPLLSKIPFLGALFRRSSTITAKTELAIFLTPRIMTGDVPNAPKPDKIEIK